MSASNRESVIAKPKQRHTWIFPGQTPSELKADPFLGVKILHAAPDWIFAEAERWPHPWRFLRDVRSLPPACYDLFKAAESVSHAMNRYQKMPAGLATFQRDLADEMCKRSQTGDAKGAKQVGAKIITAMLKHGLWRDDFRSEARREDEAMKAQAERALVKRHGRKALKPQPVLSAQEFAWKSDWTLAGYLMFSNWLRWGKRGEPGLCYYSDQALADLLAMLIKVKHSSAERFIRRDYFRKCRQLLGLEQAYYRKAFVIGARRVPNTGIIEIDCRWDEKTEQHSLAANQKLVIGGRQFYPLPV